MADKPVTTKLIDQLVNLIQRAGIIISGEDDTVAYISAWKKDCIKVLEKLK